MKNFIFILSVCALFLINGCKGDKINSTWKTQDIKIDGNDSDWGKTLTYNKDDKFLFGVTNDNKDLYLCLVTNDPDLERKILHLGLTVWFDREGSDRRVFGIKYPLNFQDMDRSSFRKPEDEPGGEDVNQEQMEKRFLERQTEVEVVGKNEDDVSRIPITALKGLKLKMDIKNYRMVYEMKIPLHPSNDAPYTINTDTGSTISVGFTTGTIDRSKFANRKPRENGVEGGYSGGGEGDYPNGGGGQGEGGMREGRRGYGMRKEGGNASMNLEPLEYWAEVKLAGMNK